MSPLQKRDEANLEIILQLWMAYPPWNWQLAPENGWLEDDPASFWGNLGLFSGAKWLASFQGVYCCISFIFNKTKKQTQGIWFWGISRYRPSYHHISASTTTVIVGKTSRQQAEKPPHHFTPPPQKNDWNDPGSSLSMEVNGRNTSISVINQQRQGIGLFSQGGGRIDQIVGVIAQHLGLQGFKVWEKDGRKI